MVDSPVAPAAPLSGARRRLVDDLRRKGITDAAVLAAVGQVPRHAFVPSGVAHRAYEDAALPIGRGQTISQPYVHARSMELLALGAADRVLEIGTGSGYQTALLGRVAKHVYSVERVQALADRAAETLRTVGVANVTLACADGTDGWPERMTPSLSGPAHQTSRRRSWTSSPKAGACSCPLAIARSSGSPSYAR
jgi:protein-L-isoaspartate(D-aspartate) O-methyltransferase